MYYSRNQWQRDLIPSQTKKSDRVLRVCTKAEPLLLKVSKKTPLPLSHKLPLSDDNLLQSPCRVLNANTESVQLWVCWCYSMTSLTSSLEQYRNTGIKSDSPLYVLSPVHFLSFPNLTFSTHPTLQSLGTLIHYAATNFHAIFLTLQGPTPCLGYDFWTSAMTCHLWHRWRHPW